MAGQSKTATRDEHGGDDEYPAQPPPIARDKCNSKPIIFLFFSCLFTQTSTQKQRQQQQVLFFTNGRVFQSRRVSRVYAASATARSIKRFLRRRYFYASFAHRCSHIYSFPINFLFFHHRLNFPLVCLPRLFISFSLSMMRT